MADYSVEGERAIREAAGAEAATQRRRRSKAERRRIVEESFAPGTSVARVARAHEVNANQVFRWRQLYRQGLLEDRSEGAAWLPVRIRDEAAEAATAGAAAAARGGPAPAGAIEVAAERGRLRIEGTADPELVRLVLER
jgi:transposase